MYFASSFATAITVWATVMSVASGFVLPFQFPLFESSAVSQAQQDDSTTVKPDGFQEVINKVFDTTKETSFAPAIPNPDENDTTAETLLEIIKALPNTSIISKLIDERPELLQDLVNPSANLTFFVPTDLAFKHLRYPPPPESITQVVLYHIVSHQWETSSFEDGQLLHSKHKSDGLLGEVQKIRVGVEEDNEGNVHIHLNGRVPVGATGLPGTDIKASNGIVHLIDSLLLPPPNAFFIVSHHPFEFGIFSLALKRTNLQKELTYTPTLTTFAPVNEAWKELGLKKLKFLFSNKGKTVLTRVLQFHIVPRVQYHEDLLDHQGEGEFTLHTLLKGEELHLEVVDTDDQVGIATRPAPLSQYIQIEKSATIAHEDILADNGAIHGIDQVLFPESEEKILAKEVDDKDDEKDDDEFVDMLLSLL